MMLIVVVQFLELQELGYNGFAWAYYEDLVLFTSTSKALCFSTPEMTEFLHGTVTACKRMPCSLSTLLWYLNVYRQSSCPTRIIMFSMFDIFIWEVKFMFCKSN